MVETFLLDLVLCLVKLMLMKVMMITRLMLRLRSCQQEQR